MKTFKTVIRTLMVTTTIVFFTLSFYEYKDQVISQAEASVPTRPDFEHDTNQQFLDNVSQCVNYIYFHYDIREVNLEILLAQASLESGWGTSRFAKVGKNLFGIRTYDLKEPHMLPSNNPKKWGVKVYQHECDSVAHYINVLNNGSAYKDYRSLLDQGITDPFVLIETLGAYATDKNYFSKVKLIVNKIRTEYNIK